MRITKYKTGSKLEKHEAYVDWLKERIKSLEKQKEKIKKELTELRARLEDNENYTPEEHCVVERG